MNNNYFVNDVVNPAGIVVRNVYANAPARTCNQLHNSVVYDQTNIGKPRLEPDKNHMLIRKWGYTKHIPCADFRAVSDRSIANVVIGTFLKI